jgi:DNA modification methylase
MVAVFREVRRVLRDDGIVFCNIGDSYAGGERGRGDKGFAGEKQATNNGSVYLDAMIPQDNMKPKDMLLIPQRLALALQADGWWIRSEIIWHKPNPMPESVTDRPTKSHETIWLMSKSARYFWDAEAVREKANDEEIRYRVELRTKNAAEYEIKMPYQNNFPNGGRVTGGRNMRDVWTFPTQNYSGAHYATYPEALVERCIRAGTSERGVCPKCGSQWVRVVEKQRPPKCVFTDTTNP